MVGTIRQNRTRVPEEVKNIALNRYDSAFFWNTSHRQLLVRYQAKQKTAVTLISTLHRSAHIHQNSKRKPHVISYYNKNKCGVDIVDSMLKMYSTRCASRRWTMAVWENLLDIAAINAWVCYQEAMHVTISRKSFIIQLVMELTRHYKELREPSSPRQVPALTSWGQKRTKCQTKGCRNRCSTACVACSRLYCGSCCSESEKRIRVSKCTVCENQL